MDTPLRSRAPLPLIAILSFVMMGYSSPACNDLLYVEPEPPTVRGLSIDAELDRPPTAPPSENDSYTWLVAQENRGEWELVGDFWGGKITTSGGDRTARIWAYCDGTAYASCSQLTRGVVIVSYRDNQGGTWGGRTEIFDWVPYTNVQLRIDAIAPCEHKECVPELLPSGP
jgi:hypothetical protein